MTFHDLGSQNKSGMSFKALAQNPIIFLLMTTVKNTINQTNFH